MNQVHLIGRLCREITLTETNQQKHVTNNTLAVPRSYATNNDQTDFIPFVAWNGTAKLLNQYVKKGDEIAITGQLQSYRYKNKNEDTVYGLSVNVQEVTFLRKKQETSEKNALPMDTDVVENSLDFINS